MNLLDSLKNDAKAGTASSVVITMTPELDAALTRESAKYGARRNKVARALLAQALVESGSLSAEDAETAVKYGPKRAQDEPAKAQAKPGK